MPVAGLGSRFLPATKSTPKEMLPVVDKPLVAYAVEEAVKSGITRFVFITSRHKKSLEDYFDNNPEMELELAIAQKASLLEVLKQTRPQGVEFVFIRQPAPRGSGDAIWRAFRSVGKNPFGVMLPDELLVQNSSGPDMRQLMDVFNATGGKNVVGVQRVENPQNYGIVSIKDKLPGLNAWPVNKIVEKPKNNPPSDLGAVGRYVFNAQFWEHLSNNQHVGHGAEICLTDAMAAACTENDMVAALLDSKRFDCGSKQGYLQATVTLALERADLGPEFKEFLKAVL